MESILYKIRRWMALPFWMAAEYHSKEADFGFRHWHERGTLGYEVAVINSKLSRLAMEMALAIENRPPGDMPPNHPSCKCVIQQTSNHK